MPVAACSPPCRGGSQAVPGTPEIKIYARLPAVSPCSGGAQVELHCCGSGAFSRRGYAAASSGVAAGAKLCGIAGITKSYLAEGSGRLTGEVHAGSGLSEAKKPLEIPLPRVNLRKNWEFPGQNRLRGYNFPPN